jgi:alkylated DNA repair dioxygenase AlkB
VARSPVDQSPASGWQPSLFGSGVVGPDRDFVRVERRVLDRGAWVDVAPGWLAGADELFDRLLHRLPWRSREVVMYDRKLPEPRCTARVPLDEAGEWAPEVADMAAALRRRYGEAFDSVGANLYRSGTDSVAWHADRHARRPDHADAVVAIVSLGSSRRFLMRPTGGGRSVAFRPGPGDLLVMGGTSQRTWQHTVPKCAAAGPRISLTFRHPVGETT